MAQKIPAGWYPLENGTLRYWDGSKWTEHISPAPGQAADPASAAHTPDESPADAPTVGAPAVAAPRVADAPVTEPIAAPPAATVPLASPAAFAASPTVIGPPPGVNVGAPADTRPWWKKKRFIIPGAGFVLFVGLIILGGIAAALGAGSSTESTRDAAPAASTTSSPEPSESATPTVFTMPDLVGDNLQDAQDELQSLGSLLMDQQDASGQGRAQVIDSNWTVCTQDPAPGVDTPITTIVTLSVVKDDEVCPGDAAAAPAVSVAPAAPELTVAQEQAVRSAEDYLDFTAFSRTGLIGQLEFEGFSTADATLAVDSLAVDWNQQAAKSAQSYLDFTSFSHSGLVDQLVFDGFTAEQAEFGVTSVGL